MNGIGIGIGSQAQRKRSLGEIEWAGMQRQVEGQTSQGSERVNERMGRQAVSVPRV